MLVRAFQRMLVSYQVQLVSYTVPGSNVRGSLNRGHYEMFLFNGEGVSVCPDCFFFFGWGLFFFFFF